MSIHPVYADEIMAGRKTVEFRKRRLAPDISTVWVYATAPVQRIVGRFEIGDTVTGHPKALWGEFHRQGCIAESDFVTYFCGSEVGVAIQIDSVEQLQVPLELSDVLPSGVPPQSFAYVVTQNPSDRRDD